MAADALLGTKEGHKSNFSGSGRSTLHRPADLQFAKVCADVRLRGFHRLLEKIYGALNLKACRVEFERFVVELQKKWSDRPVAANWSLVRNQLILNERLATLFDKFEH